MLWWSSPLALPTNNALILAGCRQFPRFRYIFVLYIFLTLVAMYLQSDPMELISDSICTYDYV